MRQDTHIWIPKDIKKRAKELKLRLSVICSDAILQEIRKNDGDFRREDNEIKIAAKCPYDGCHRETITTSVHIVRCWACGRRYRVYTLKYGLRGDLIRGSKKELGDKIARTYYHNKRGAIL